jgi:hypothetical protein
MVYDNSLNQVYIIGSNYTTFTLYVAPTNTTDGTIYKPTNYTIFSKKYNMTMGITAVNALPGIVFIAITDRECGNTIVLVVKHDGTLLSQFAVLGIHAIGMSGINNITTCFL